MKLRELFAAGSEDKAAMSMFVLGIGCAAIDAMRASAGKPPVTLRAAT